jgi:hypothetical protein
MKKKVFISLWLLCVSFAARAQHGFDMLYNFSEDTSIISSEIASAYADTDVYFVTGATETPAISTLHGFLAAFDYSGNIRWEQKLLFPGLYNAYSSYTGIAKMRENRYVMIGTVVDTSVNPDIYVLFPYFYIFDKDGDSIDFSEYRDSFVSRTFNSIIFDGKNIVTAGTITTKSLTYDPTSKSYGYDSEAIWLCKFDTLGNIIWQHNIMMQSSLQVPTINRIVISADRQHYLIAAIAFDTITNQYAVCLIKTDTSGNINWIKELPQEYLSYLAIDVAASPSGGYYFASSSATKPPRMLGHSGESMWGNAELYFGKLDENGDTVWTRKYGHKVPAPADTGYYDFVDQHIAIDKDNNLLIESTTLFYYFSPAFIKADSMGNVEWYRQYLHVQYLGFDRELNNVSVTPQNQYLLTGEFDGGVVPGIFDSSGKMGWMILTDSNGMRFPNDTVITFLNVEGSQNNFVAIAVYPNPFNSNLIIEHAIPGSTFEITDIIGRTYCKGTIENVKQILNLPELPKGIYILKISNISTREVNTYKLLKE